MIVPMKRALVIVQEKDADSAVVKLRSFGVLHPEHQKPPSGKDISALEEDIMLLSQAVNILSEAEFSGAESGESKEPQDWKFTARHIVDMRKRIEQLKEYSLKLKSRIIQWDEWGDFEPERVKSLSRKNIYVRFYQVPVKEVNNLTDNIIVKKVSVVRGIANCAVITRENITLPYPELHLPKTGLKEMRSRLAEDARVIESIKEEIKKHACYRKGLVETKGLLDKELEFHRARSGMGQANRLAYLAGYIPSDTTERFLQISKKERWGAVISEPSEEDAVPTLIHNPRWVSVIRPVFKLLEIIPGYRELDISPLFLCFLSLFFGMIIGDAGYGTVYFLLAFWLHKKFAKKNTDNRIFLLIYIFSACAIFWGLLTGTFFGQEWFLKAGFSPLMPLLNDTKFLQAFCFFLGAAHLTLAHGWQAIRKSPSLAALSDIGWIFVLWAAFFLAKMLILNDPFPSFGKWLIITGLILVVFCAHPQRSIFKTIGHGLGAAALNLMNNFTDVVSYVRLFAIGLAGVAIADTVNSLASGLGPGNTLAKAGIVFLGHSINIILGPMSVMVHGIRLNVLEFSSHAGLSWSGIAYRPLRE